MNALNKSLPPVTLARDGGKAEKSEVRAQTPHLDYTISGLFTDVKKARQGHYKDSLAKLHNLRSDYVRGDNDPKKDRNGKVLSEYDCTKWGLEAYCDNPSCENEDHYVKAIICNSEWCPSCGQDGSFMHMRRVARWLPKAQQIESMGYIVIELPVKSRGKMRSKSSLSAFGKKARRILKEYGFNRGLSRWHWFGDDGLRGWNPHLNLVVDGRYLSKSELRALKRTLRKRLHEPNLIVHYSYTSERSKMLHILRYCNRPTFKDQSWDYAMSEVVHGFRSSQTWGSVEDWSQPVAWQIDCEENQSNDGLGIVQLEKGLCPKCGEKLKWLPEVVPLALVQAMPGCQDLGGGYYRLPNIEWNKSSPLDGDDQYFMNLRHEMRMHGLFRGKRVKGHIRCVPGQREFEYLVSQGKEIYPSFFDDGGLHMNSYEVAMSEWW